MEHGNAMNPSETPFGNVTCDVHDDEGMPSWAKRLFNRLANVEANTSLIWAFMKKASSSTQPLSCPPRITVHSYQSSDGDDFKEDDANIILDISSDDEEVRKKTTRRKMNVSKRQPKKEAEKTQRRGSQFSKRIPNKKKHSKSTSVGFEQPTTSKGGRALPDCGKKLFQSPRAVPAVLRKLLVVQWTVPTLLGGHGSHVHGP
ncbi:hypothetical protein SESBI_12877 [Sesbania bispinosa]|nr:hypothetical protein SESBI_12877 [Sesbania bispinosa]